MVPGDRGRGRMEAKTGSEELQAWVRERSLGSSEERELPEPLPMSWSF